MWFPTMVVMAAPMQYTMYDVKYTIYNRYVTKVSVEWAPHTHVCKENGGAVSMLFAALSQIHGI